MNQCKEPYLEIGIIVKMHLVFSGKMKNMDMKFGVDIKLIIAQYLVFACIMLLQDYSGGLYCTPHA